MKNNKYKIIYIGSTVICLLILLFIMLWTKGIYFNQYFSSDMLDVGMDFFHSILYTKGRHPYTRFNVIYPPLANMFFWGIYRCVPSWISATWPKDFAGSIAFRNTELDLRTMQVTMFSYILFIMVVSVLFLCVLSAAFENQKIGLLIGISLLLSFGSLYAIERGNIIILSALFLLVFIVFYQSNNKYMREIALICLAISAGLKIYPALFGVLLIIEKRWKEAFRTILYGIFFFFVPFIFFEGLEGFKCLLKALVGFSEQGTYLTFCSYKLDRIIQSVIIQASYIKEFDFYLFFWNNGNWIKVISYVIIVLLILCVFLSEEKYEKLIAIGLCILFMHMSYNYTLLFMLPALIEILRIEKYDKKTVCAFILVSIICLPIPLVGIVRSEGLTRILILKQDALLITAILLIVTTMNNVLFRRKRAAIASC